jgi:hypothetical protein
MSFPSLRPRRVTLCFAIGCDATTRRRNGALASLRHPDATTRRRDDATVMDVAVTQRRIAHRILYRAAWPGHADHDLWMVSVERLPVVSCGWTRSDAPRGTYHNATVPYRYALYTVVAAYTVGAPPRALGRPLAYSLADQEHPYDHS